MVNRTFSLDALRSFVAIFETGTFRRAAARVNRSPSAISLQVGKLEEQVGAKLLSRDARHVDLTEQGEVLLRYARQLLGISDEAMSLFHGSSLVGRLKLAAPHDLGIIVVPKLLKRLAETHPGVSVDVRLGACDNLQERFAAGEIDFALFNDIKNPAFKVEVLSREPLAWVMHQRGRAITREPLPLATAERGCAWRDVALRALEENGLPYRVAYYSDTSMGQIAALRADLAVAALPLSLAVGDLIPVPAKYGLPTLPNSHVYLAHDGSDLAKVLAVLALFELNQP